jgi:uncharacterized protein (DUF58 family)
MQTPYARVYNEERDITAWFVLDLSPSIDFGSQTVNKRAVATELVTVLARMLTRHGNRVGALFYGDSVDTVIPARSGRRQVLHILHKMLGRPEVELAVCIRFSRIKEIRHESMEPPLDVFAVSPHRRDRTDRGGGT